MKRAGKGAGPSDSGSGLPLKKASKRVDELCEPDPNRSVRFGTYTWRDSPGSPPTAVVEYSGDDKRAMIALNYPYWQHRNVAAFQASFPLQQPGPPILGDGSRSLPSGSPQFVELADSADGSTAKMQSVGAASSSSVSSSSSSSGSAASSHVVPSSSFSSSSSSSDSGSAASSAVVSSDGSSTNPSSSSDGSAPTSQYPTLSEASSTSTEGDKECLMIMHGQLHFFMFNEEDQQRQKKSVPVELGYHRGYQQLLSDDLKAPTPRSLLNVTGRVCTGDPFIGVGRRVRVVEWAEITDKLGNPFINCEGTVIAGPHRAGWYTVRLDCGGMELRFVRANLIDVAMERWYNSLHKEASKGYEVAPGESDAEQPPANLYMSRIADIVGRLGYGRRRVGLAAAGSSSSASSSSSRGTALMDGLASRGGGGEAFDGASPVSVGVRGAGAVADHGERDGPAASGTAGGQAAPHDPQRPEIKHNHTAGVNIYIRHLRMQQLDFTCSSCGSQFSADTARALDLAHRDPATKGQWLQGSSVPKRRWGGLLAMSFYLTVADFTREVFEACDVLCVACHRLHDSFISDDGTVADGSRWTRQQQEYADWRDGGCEYGRDLERDHGRDWLDSTERPTSCLFDGSVAGWPAARGRFHAMCEADGVPRCVQVACVMEGDHVGKNPIKHERLTGRSGRPPISVHMLPRQQFEQELQHMRRLCFACHRWVTHGPPTVPTNIIYGEVYNQLLAGLGNPLLDARTLEDFERANKDWPSFMRLRAQGT